MILKNENTFGGSDEREKKIQVTLGNYKGVEVKKAEIIITEEEVKAELERARQYAVTTQDKDGAAELGDEAVIDFVGYIDGEAFAGGDGTDFPLNLVPIRSFRDLKIS